MMGGETVPEWVLTEVGRLHLHALALERDAQRLTAERDDLLHLADKAPEHAGTVKDPLPTPPMTPARVQNC